MSGGRVGGAADVALATQLQLCASEAEPESRFVVGVIDTGVLVGNDGQAHPFLRRRLRATWTENTDRPTDGRLGPHDGHGTFVAGLIHARAPTATLDVRNALDDAPNRAGDRPGTDDIRSNDGRVADQIRALTEVDELKLVNLSFFGDGAPEPEPPPEIRDALRDLFDRRPEVLVVTAAGNRWTAEPTFPARFKEEFEQVIAVGAVDDTVTPVPGLPLPRASFSSYWAGIDLYAPGVRVLGPYVSGRFSTDAAAQDFTGWCRWSGTSFAAATVTGLLAAAMINEGLTGPQARERVVPRLFPPVPGIAGEHWKPLLAVTNSVCRQSDRVWSAGGTTDAG
jgi:subtilisin family serine protease